MSRDRIYDLGGHMGRNHPSPVVRVKENGETSLQMAQPMRAGGTIDPRDDVVAVDEHGYYAEPITSARRTVRTGPAQVATPAYRANYETIFGHKAERGQA